MRMGDAYIIVYSVTDKSSFEKASELRIQLRRARQSENIPIILVGNKTDLVRSREVSVDGRYTMCALGSLVNKPSLVPLLGHPSRKLSSSLLGLNIHSRVTDAWGTK